jgi:hypothetical protein
MRLLAELLMLPVTGPVRALRFIAEQIQAEMDGALLNEGQIEAELISLSLRHDLGEIDGAQYEAEEARLLDQLDAIRAYQLALLEDYQAAYAEQSLDPSEESAGWVDTAGAGQWMASSEPEGSA